MTESTHRGIPNQKGDFHMRTLPQTHKRIATAIFSSGLAVIAACSSMAAMSETVTLAGSNEVPPVTTSATGSANITIGADRSVKATVTATGMTATASHIHMAAAGSNGPVIVPFTKTGDTFSAAADAKLTEEQYAAYKAGKLYVNVHSAANPGGEVRAQLKGS
jgi:CHRD domain